MAYRVPQTGQGSGYDDADIAAVVDLLRSPAHLSDGHQVALFERDFATRIGARDAVAVTSCTMALELVTRVLDLRAGDEVIATPLTFQATTAALLGLPVRVRFADIDPDTLCLDPAAVARLITPRTRAIYTTHYAGLCGGIRELASLAQQHDITLVEDCAHALGASADDKAAGSWGDFGCWSFHSLKNISTLGQGGMVTTRDPERAERIRALRAMNPDARFVPRHRSMSFGRYGTPTLPRPVTHEKNAYTHDCASIRGSGLNATMSEPAAAVGRTQLARLPDLLERRRMLAGLLDRGLADVSGVRVLPVPPGHEHARHLYPVLLDGPTPARDDVARRLEALGVEIVLRYFPLHLLPEWRAKGCRLGTAPVAERLWFTRLLNLPLSPQLSIDQIEYVVAAVRSALQPEQTHREVLADAR
ncbi:MAG TPA: DegT/DnrJ/EryC1/StrS family aminotransferase [Pseudonocardiaceae bacterium]|nr:DegT/DnrJ/EryC1/StrS family aminotransferase [Pseudonocardiaceae bacterium]